jgi:hypothetical protein
MDRYFRNADSKLSTHLPVPSLIPSAWAESCVLAATFQPCSPLRTITRNFGGCTIGSSTLTGTVSLAWSGTGFGCSLTPATAELSTVTRKPEFTLTTRSGATLNVKLTTSAVFGQKLTYVSGSGSTAVFHFSSDGIRTTLKDATGFLVSDLTSQTSSDLIITGSSRVPRILSGGTLRIANNVNNVSCDFTPSAIAWSGTCNCPTSGSWSGTCSNGPSATLMLTGCGSAILTSGASSQSVNFDRCYGI